ncbi:MAG: hypothetical protein Fur0021_32550 [Candidatus Promineifilaceae bacterium]
MNLRQHAGANSRDCPFVLISAGALLICLYYVYARIYLLPQPGLTIGSNWVVTEILPCAPSGLPCAGDVHVGDRFLVIGDLDYDTYRRDWRMTPFGGYEAGDKVPIQLMRGEGAETITVLWEMPASVIASPLRDFGSLLMFLPFWLAGTIIMFFLQPHDRRWQILIATNFLVSIWFVSGTDAAWQVHASSLVLRVTSWLLMPVLLHLHLIVPAPRWATIRPYLLSTLYGLAAIMVILEIWGNVPSSSYLIGLILSILISIGLLLTSLRAHHAASRQAARTMLAGLALAFGPGILFVLLRNDATAPSLTPLLTGIALLSVPLWSLFYTYAIFRRYLGDLEFRVSRLLGSYSFGLIYLIIFVVTFWVTNQWLGMGEPIVFGAIISTFFVILAPLLRPSYMRLVEQIFHGAIPYEDTSIEDFAGRVSKAVRHEDLARVLEQEIAPKLLIRQSALCLLVGSQLEPAYSQGLLPHQLPASPSQIDYLKTVASRYLPPTQPAHPNLAWIRLAIPLQLGHRLLGFWLLGRRDPDDFYPQRDISLLAALAGYVAIAIENAQLYERLRAYAAELEERVNERTRELASANIRLQELDRLKSKFVSNVSHELRTPITNLELYLGLLEQVNDPAKRTRYLNILKHETKRLIQLTEDILDLARLDLSRESEGKDSYKVSFQTIELNALVENMVEIHTPLAEANGLRLTFVPGRQPYLIRGERNQLMQVITNLLVNAINYTPHGQVWVSTHRLLATGQVCLLVQDTGIGIEAEDLPYLFERFYRGQQAVQSTIRGTGLGLSIVNEIVRLHEGQIQVRSQPKQGTSVIVRFPLTEAEEPPPQEAIGILSHSAAHLRQLLAAEQYPTHSFTDVAELRRHLAQEPLALLIADVALAKELAALDVPCLWLVENAGIAQTLLASAQFNFRDLLVEPLTPDDLLIALHAALVRRQ